MINKNVINRPYEDMINLEYHGTKNREPMPIIDRAAQFSPFAALTGYDTAIKETARLTDKRIELDETEKAMLDEKIRILQNQISLRPEVEFKFFQSDERKSGGVYRSIIGVMKKLNLSLGMIVLEDGTKIPISDILEMNGDIFTNIMD